MVRRTMVSGSAAGMLLLAFSCLPAYSQNAAGQPAEAAAPAPSSAKKEDMDNLQELSMYGEVQAVSAASNSITVQYYDYDTDEEKTAAIAVTASTKIENAAGLADIKKGDWIDITYSVINGVNAAKYITVEKEEGLTEEADYGGGEKLPVDPDEE